MEDNGAPSTFWMNYPFNQVPNMLKTAVNVSCLVTEH